MLVHFHKLAFRHQVSKMLSGVSMIAGISVTCAIPEAIVLSANWKIAYA